MTPFIELFTPVSIRGMTVKNRVVMPSMLTHMASVNGEVTDRLAAYYAERAKGGAGLIFPEATAVDDSGLSYFRGLSIAHDRYVPGLKKLARAIHEHGSRAGIQLGHGGRYAQPEFSRSARRLVSYLPGISPEEDARVMDKEEIERLAGCFVQAAERAAQAGFDMVEIHGAHGYLIGSFLSPFTNRRTDEWGGSFENRMRFAEVVIRGIRRRLGPDFPLSFRLSSDEFLPGGITVDLAAKIAAYVVHCGVDLVHVSAGMIDTNRFTGPPPVLPMGWNADNAAVIRKTLEGTNALVTVAGRIHDGDTAERILREGKADLVSIGRALIADPWLPHKLETGQLKKITPCLSCNEGCVGSIGKNRPLSCAVNPRVGFEQRPARHVENARKVVIVGAGVAGMEAALTAARLGHAITLLEKDSRLGGLVNIAALPPHKDIFLRLIDHMSHELVENGVKLVLGNAVSAADLKAMAPDVIIVATGSRPVIPGFLKNSSAMTAADVLSGCPTGQKTLVLGGGLVGAETAEFLAAQGKEVAVLEMRDEIAPDMQGRARAFLMEELSARHVKLMTGLEVRSVDGNGVVIVKDRYGNEYPLPRYDTLVAAMGYRSEQSLCAELTREGMRFVAIGDCVKADKIMAAVHQGYHAAKAI